MHTAESCAEDVVVQEKKSYEVAGLATDHPLATGGRSKRRSRRLSLTETSMSMTRKDYELIARTFTKPLADVQTYLAHNPSDQRAQAIQAALTNQVHDLARALRCTNPMFKEDVFTKACGVTA